VPSFSFDPIADATAVVALLVMLVDGATKKDLHLANLRILLNASHGLGTARLIHASSVI
jgi:hypothetical protein